MRVSVYYREVDQFSSFVRKKICLFGTVIKDKHDLNVFAYKTKMFQLPPF